MTLWEFFNSTAGGASILGGILAIAGYFGACTTNRMIAQMHGETQTTLRSLGEILARMETNAEDRHRDLKDRLRGSAEA